MPGEDQIGGIKERFWFAVSHFVFDCEILYTDSEGVEFMFLTADDRVEAEDQIDFLFELYLNFELDVFDAELKCVHEVLFELFDQRRS